MHGGAEGVPVSLPSVSKMSFPVNSSPYLNSLRKRILDIVAAILALVPFVLLFPLLALLIKITSPGPVFYSRERLGQHGTVFKMLKLRTMYIGSDNKLKDLRTTKRRCAHHSGGKISSQDLSRRISTILECIDRHYECSRASP